MSSCQPPSGSRPFSMCVTSKLILNSDAWVVAWEWLIDSDEGRWVGPIQFANWELLSYTDGAAIKRGKWMLGAMKAKDGRCVLVCNYIALHSTPHPTPQPRPTTNPPCSVYLFDVRNMQHELVAGQTTRSCWFLPQSRAANSPSQPPHNAPH